MPEVAELVDIKALCDRVAKGESVQSALAVMSLPSHTALTWLKAHPTARESLRQARGTDTWKAAHEMRKADSQKQMETFRAAELIGR